MKAQGLDSLAALKRAMQQARRDAEREVVRDREVAAAARLEHDLFAVTVGQVLPLRRTVLPLPIRPRPPAVPQQRTRDEAAVLVESISDEFNVESLLETDDMLSFRRRDVGPEVVRKLRRGVFALQVEIYMHGIRREEARDRLAAFLRMAAQSGKRCVRVVHGKGLGSPGREPVLKGKVKSWLMQRSEVLAFTYARPADGGHGALIVLLEPADRTQNSPRSAPPRR